MAILRFRYFGRGIGLRAPASGLGAVPVLGQVQESRKRRAHEEKPAFVVLLRPEA